MSRSSQRMLSLRASRQRSRCLRRRTSSPGRQTPLRSDFNRGFIARTEARDCYLCRDSLVSNHRLDLCRKLFSQLHIAHSGTSTRVEKVKVFPYGIAEDSSSGAADGKAEHLSRTVPSPAQPDERLVEDALHPVINGRVSGSDESWQELVRLLHHFRCPARVVHTEAPGAYQSGAILQDGMRAWTMAC